MEERLDFMNQRRLLTNYENLKLEIKNLVQLSSILLHYGMKINLTTNLDAATTEKIIEKLKDIKHYDKKFTENVIANLVI